MGSWEDRMEAGHRTRVADRRTNAIRAQARATNRVANALEKGERLEAVRSAAVRLADAVDEMRASSDLRVWQKVLEAVDEFRRVSEETDG